MLRSFYLATLLALQLALIVKVAPPLALALRAEAMTSAAPEGWPALLQLGTTGLAVAGTTLALVFPGIALARHGRAGAHRFLGLPGWAVALALSGTTLLAAAALAPVLALLLPGDDRAAAVLVARPGAVAGLALAAAGVLCAELLRRSVATSHASMRDARVPTGRIEVTYPPELRTRAVPSARGQAHGQAHGTPV